MNKITVLKEDSGLFYFLIFSILFLLFSVIFFHPIIDGDSVVYIANAKEVLGFIDDYDTGNRSPMYSWIIAIFMYVFGVEDFHKPLIIFQFLLNIFTGLEIYFIFKKITKIKLVATISGILYLLNFSVINYSYFILSENVAMFLFATSLLYLTYLLENPQKRNLYIKLGFVSSLMVLTRFNLFFIPFIYLLIIIVFMFFKSRKFSSNLLWYMAVVAVVFNLWSFRNYTTHGFYFLFPASGNSMSRNGLLGMLDEKTTVTDEYQELKTIFLFTKKQLMEKDSEGKKGSLIGSLPFLKEEVRGYTLGYRVYKETLPTLFGYFGYEADVYKYKNAVDRKLESFYRDLKASNSTDVWGVRLFSMLYGLRASNPSLSSKYDHNLNYLPDVIIKIYKFLFIAIIYIYYLLSFSYLIKSTYKRDINFGILSLILITYYFPAINFVQATVNDASRFSFFSEPFITGMAVYFINDFVIKKKTT